MLNDQNEKSLIFEISLLKFVWNLSFGIWNFSQEKTNDFRQI